MAADERGISYRFIINQSSLLSWEETQELLSKKGTPEWPAAREELILSNLKLIISIAKKYVWIDGYSWDDVISYGVIGLMKAIDRYDPKIGTKLSTYVVYWINAAIWNELLYKKGLIRNPAHMEKLVAKMDKYQKETEKKTGRKLSVEDLSKLMKLPEKKIRFILELHNRNMESLDAPAYAADSCGVNDSGFLAGDTVHSKDDVEDEAVRRVTLAEIMAAIKKLKPNEQKVIMLKFGFVGGEPMSMEQCSKKLGCSEETARRNLKAAIRKLQAVYYGRSD